MVVSEADALLALTAAVRLGERLAIRDAATRARELGIPDEVVEALMEISRPRTLRLRVATELDRRIARDLDLPLIVEIGGRAAPLSHAAQAALGIGFEGRLDDAIARITGEPAGSGVVVALLDQVALAGVGNAVIEAARAWRVTAWRDEDDRVRVLLRPRGGAAVGSGESTQATLVHELSNGLTAIATLAALGARAPADERDSVFRRIERAASDTLDAVRVARRRGSVPPPATTEVPRADVSGVLADLLERFEVLGREREIRLFTRLGSELAVAARPAEVRSIVWNLVKNAFEAVPRGGTVRVGASLHEDRIRVVVDDDGPGMTESQRARIFEPYYTTKSDGTGLGLPLVKHLVERLEGELTLETAPGRGARFVVTLPSAPETRVPSVSGARPRRPLEGAVVAVGDVTESWRAELERLGARVVRVGIGDEPDVAWLSQRDEPAIAAAQVSATNVCWSEDDLEPLLSWWSMRTGASHVG